MAAEATLSASSSSCYLINRILCGFIAHDAHLVSDANLWLATAQAI
jgi:hypothetical protein